MNIEETSPMTRPHGVSSLGGMAPVQPQPSCSWIMPSSSWPAAHARIFDSVDVGQSMMYGMWRSPSLCTLSMFTQS